ncbi:MAG: S8 family serine peptidase [Myxococcota bacterium]
MLLLLVACSPTDVIDAGDPSVTDGFDLDALYSDAADAGWENVPGQYNVLVADGAKDGLLADLDGELVDELVIAPVFTARMTFAEAQRLAKHPDVISVEPDWLAFASARGGSACASSASQTTPAGVSAMGTNSAGRTGSGVAVAVLDTGIDNTHTDLTVAGIVDKTGGRGGGVDDNGHGTHVAGSIAALNNSRGVVGVAPAASLYGVKVLDRRGSGSYSTIASGVDWAVTNGMDVVNMSLGGTSNSATLHASITAAYAAGVIQVVAAGNSGVSATREYPANYDGEVLTVSAWDPATSTFPSWSNYGVPPVDVAAPGVGVCSTAKGGSYESMDGTSMATPHVAGAVALYLQGNPGASFATVEAAIEGNVSALANTATHSEDLSVVTGL